VSETKPLDLSASRRTLGLAAMLVVAALSLGSVVHVEQGPLAIATGVQRAEPVSIRHADAGQIARWTVATGVQVAAGDVVATLDTRALDALIDALKKQIGAVRARAEAIRLEALAVAGVDGTPGARVATLESHVADLDREEVGLNVRLSMHEQDRQRTVVKSPVSGRLADVSVGDGGSFKAGATLAVVVPEAGRARLEVTWPAGAAGLRVNAPVRAWPDDTIIPAWISSGRIETVDEPDQTGRVRTKVVVSIAGTPLAEPRPQEHSRRFMVQVLTEQRPLLAHFVAPLWRPSPILNASSR
jgi:multidrug resistance efflux pump